MHVALETVVQPAIDQLAASHLKYMSTTRPEKIAASILGNRFRSGGMDPNVLAQSRITNSRSTKIGHALQYSCHLLASRRQGAQVLQGESPVTFEMWVNETRLLVSVQSREDTLNKAVQERAKREQLINLQMQSTAARTYVLVVFAAESTQEAQCFTSADGIINVYGPLFFHWLSGDPSCFDRLSQLCEARLSARDVRIAESRFRGAVERCLIEMSTEAPDSATYNTSRRDLESVLGSCAAVLVDNPEAVPPPPDFFDQFDGLE